MRLVFPTAGPHAVALAACVVARLRRGRPAGAGRGHGTTSIRRTRRSCSRSPASLPTPAGTTRRRVYWGDTHLHTSMSLDARAGGNTLGPEEALRFARGEEVVAATGEPAKLSRPLDWLVVADHSDAMGTMNEIAKGNPQLMTDPTVRGWHDAIAQGGEVGMKAAYNVVETLSAGKIPPVMLDPEADAVAVGTTDGHHGEVQRARPVHRVHRLRVDEQQHRQQPAPQRDLPRRQGEGRPGPALHDGRQREPRGPVEVDAGVRGEDRRLAARHPAQRQPVERPDVQARDVQGQPAHEGVGHDAGQLGAALRDHADQG